MDALLWDRIVAAKVPFGPSAGVSIASLNDEALADYIANKEVEVFYPVSHSLAVKLSEHREAQKPKPEPEPEPTPEPTPDEPAEPATPEPEPTPEPTPDDPKLSAPPFLKKVPKK